MLALPVVAFALAGLFADVGSKAEPLDRIAALVADKPIFLSEVRHRLAPHVKRIDLIAKDENERATLRATTTRDLVERMIDERLEAKEAETMHLSVDDAEIESGIKQVAAQAKVSRAELLDQVRVLGMTEAEYKDEIRRQVLEGKLMQLRVRPRVRVTDADARKTYETFVKEQSGANMPVDLRFVVLQVPADATADAKKAIEARAQEILKQARSGADFCALAKKYSEDEATKNKCGSTGPVARSSLMPAIAKATADLKPGETAPAPLFYNPLMTASYLVIQRAPGAPPAVPKYETVKEQMMERSMLEATERERKNWIAELRKATYVEVKQ